MLFASRSLAAALVLAAGIGTPAYTAEVTISQFGTGEDGRPVFALTLAGEIDDGDDHKVDTALERARGGRYFPGFVELKSPGGDSDASLGIAATVQRYGMPILVRTRCSSGCAVIALSAWRGRLFVVESGAIGLHQSWRCNHSETHDPGCKNGKAVPAMDTTWRIAAALESYGVPGPIIEKMVKAPPDGMTFLDAGDLRALGAMTDQ